MRSWRFAIPVLLVGALPTFSGVDREAIDKVAAGKVDVVKASWWGFDPEESTGALQAAIDSGARKVIVEKMDSPWVVNPITLKSNQEVVFEEGVEVRAKRGEFKDNNESLFTGKGIENVTLRGYGAVLRMWRNDYAGSDYEPGEWRHVLRFGNTANIKVYGLTLAESGGDGIYLGSGFNRNVHIKDVTCDRNYRQGISVITAEDLLIEDCVLKNTSGTPPMCGIDFEPNNPDQRLANCVMRNCVTKDNASSGYTIAIGRTAGPVSLRFENCRSVGDAHAGVSLDLPNDPETFKGTIDFVNCSFEQNRGVGIQVKGSPAGGCRVRFENCSILDPVSSNPKATPILFVADRGSRFPIGNVHFGEMRVRGPADRRPISFADMAGVGLKDVTGTLLVEQGEPIELTDELIAEWMPASVMAEIPRLALDDATLQPVGNAASVPPDALKFAVMRSSQTLLLHANEGDSVTLHIKFSQLANYSGRPIPVSAVSPSGQAIDCAPLEFKAVTETGFEAPETGIYRLSLSPGANLVTVQSSTHPLLIGGEQGPVHLLGTTGTFYFWVPEGTAQFGVQVSGEGVGEAVRAALVNPEGEVVEEIDNASAHQFEITQSVLTPGQAWAIQLMRPSQIAFEDQHVDLRGIPPLLAGAKGALLKPKRK